MQYLKYLAVLFVSINAFGCCETKAVANLTGNEAIIKLDTIIKTDIEVEAEVIKNEVVTEIPAAETKTEIENEILTDFKTVDHSLWNDLLQKHVSDQGNVNYKGFNADHAKFNSYLELLTKNPPQESWSKDETLAYWMNVYNAYTVKLILDNYPTKSIKDINGPWNQRFIKIDEKWYTLNDVEHKIIRKMGEPRIHFALVCAAVSCPRLYNKAFTANHLETDLDVLTRGFLNDTTKNELSEDHIKISKIFKWYGGDFKTNGNNLIDFLNQYSEVKISPNAKKSYKDYNWNINE